MTALVWWLIYLVGAWLAFGITMRILYKSEVRNTRDHWAHDFDWFNVTFPAAWTGIAWPLVLPLLGLGVTCYGIWLLTKRVFIPEIKRNEKHEKKAEEFEVQANKYYDDYVFERNSGSRELASNLFDLSKSYRGFAEDERKMIER